MNCVLKRILVLFILIIWSFSFAEYYILTDLGKGVEKIEVELLTPEPIYIQDSPNMKVYVIKFKDKNLPVAAGMSGSPLISNGKVLGALFAGYSFQKEPLAYVIPIEYMNRIKDGHKVDSQNNLSSPIPLVVNFPNEKSVNLFYGNLRKIFSSNTTFSYISIKETKAVDESIKEGSSISVALVDGDIKIFVTGTLTKVDKEGYFLAFGHSMFNLGKVSMPVYKSNVISIVNRYDDSFKLSAITDQKIGSIIFDCNYGVLGKIGQESKMIPLNIELLASNKRIKNYSCYVVDNPKLTYVLSLIAFYSAVNPYIQSDLPYEFSMNVGFINGRVQNITIPSINTPIEKVLSLVYEYLNFLSNIPASDNKVNYIKYSLNLNNQNLGIINNISISGRQENNISFDINYFDPVLKRSGRETINVVFPSEAANESLNFCVGGQYDLPRMFEELGIISSNPKDFNQLITYINFFSTPDPRSIAVVISTKLYGAINLHGKIFPLTTPQMYKYYLQYSMPFIYLSYYPIIIQHKTNFIPVGYDVFQIDVNGSISKAEREKKDKEEMYYIKNIISNNNDKIFIGQRLRRMSDEKDIQKEIYDVLKDYDKGDGDKELSKEKSQKDDAEGYSNMVNLSRYEDLIDGIQKNVAVDYQSNIISHPKKLREIKFGKTLFKILYHNKNFLGFSYNFDNTTSLYVFDYLGKTKHSLKFNGIFSDVRFSRGKIIACTFDGQILIINPVDFSIERRIDTEYVWQNVDFYKNYIVAANIKYPSSIVFFSIDGKKVKEEVLPFINISNLVIDGDNILVACYGGMVLKMNDTEKIYFQTYQENITALKVIDGNLFIGTYPKPYLYIVPNYDKNDEFNRPILYDGFDNEGYIEDITTFKDRIYLSYKGNKLSVFSIKKDHLLGTINNTFQKTNNLNWEKTLSIQNFYWFISFINSSDKFYIPYISNTFTIVNFLDYSKDDEKGYYVSKIFDAGQQKYLYDFIIRAEGNYELFFRMGNNPIVDQTWTEWINYKEIKDRSLRYRYFQYKIVLYPKTTVYSVYGLFKKINYKPFFIIDSTKKVYNSENSINLNIWDPNGDKVNIVLQYYDGKQWVEIDKKQIETKKTDVNTPDFSTNTSLSLSNLNIHGKVKLKVSIDDSLLNPSNYFIQEQEFEIFIDNTEPIVKKYTYSNNVLRVVVEDDSFVEVFIQYEKNTIPMILNRREKNIYEYTLTINKLDLNSYIFIRDEAGNINKLQINQ